MTGSAPRNSGGCRVKSWTGVDNNGGILLKLQGMSMCPTGLYHFDPVTDTEL